MSGRQLFGQPEDLIMTAANETVTTHFGRIGRRQRDRDGVGVHVQTHVEGRAPTARDDALNPRIGLWIGRFEELSLLRLDRVRVAEYVGFHGVCFPFYGCMNLGSQHWGSAPHSRCNRRSRRADTCLAVMQSHSV